MPNEMHMMTWQNATSKQMTWKGRRITGRHLAQRTRGVTAGYKLATRTEEAPRATRYEEMMHLLGVVQESTLITNNSLGPRGFCLGSAPNPNSLVMDADANLGVLDDPQVYGINRSTFNK